jgi:hypothetical protein
MTALSGFYANPLSWQVFDDNGNPGAGFKLHVYEANTTTETDSYTTPACGTANANPVVFDATGRATICLKNNIAYKLILTDANDVVIWTKDNYHGSGAGGAGGGVFLTVKTIADLEALNSGEADFVAVQGYYAKGDGGGGYFYWDSGVPTAQDGGMFVYPADDQVGCNNGRYVRMISENAEVNIKWFGCKGTGSDDCVATISAADDYVQSLSGKISALYVPAGSFLLSNDPALVSNVHFGMGGILKIARPIYPTIKPIIDDIDTHFTIVGGYFKFPAGSTSNVKWFGAVGNGTTNDAPAFINAFYSLYSGGKLVINEATYLITGCISTCPSGVIIQGQGHNTILKATLNAGSATGMIALVNAGNVIIENLAFDGNGANQATTSAAITGYGADIIIRGCKFYDCKDNAIVLGITGFAAVYATVENCLFGGNGLNHTGCSIKVVNGDHITIRGNEIIDATSASRAGIGLHALTTTAVLTNVIIDNNKLIGCNIQHEPDGAYVADSLEITGNTVDLRTQLGYGNPNCINIISATGDNVIDGNTLYSNGVKAGVKIL